MLDTILAADCVILPAYLRALKLVASMNEQAGTIPEEATTDTAEPLRAAVQQPVTACSAHQRILSILIFACTFTVLALAAWLTPSDRGHGTHESLGLPPCGMLQRTGVPCATCGMTTSFSYAADGNFVQSFITQPAGAILAIVTAATCLLTGYAAVTGMPILPIIMRITKPSVVWISLTILLLGWIYKILVTIG